MSEALQLARQVAVKDLSWVKTVGKEEKFVLAAQATLNAIDAAIAAEVPATKVCIDLGDLTVEATVSVEEGKRLMAAQTRRKSEPIRIPIEVDTSSIEETLAYLKAEKARVATAALMGAVVGDDDAPPLLPEGFFAGNRPIQVGDTVEITSKFRVVGMSERSTDGQFCLSDKESGLFCQLEMDGYGFVKEIEVTASDLRRCS